MQLHRPYSPEVCVPGGVDLFTHMPIRRALTDLVGEYLLDYEQAALTEALTVAQARVLAFAVDGLSMREIADRFGCDPSNITGKVDRLVALKLVERRPDPLDARVKRIHATSAGTAAAVRICSRRVWLHAILDQLDEREAAQVESALFLLLRVSTPARSGPPISDPDRRAGSQSPTCPGAEPQSSWNRERNTS